MCPIGAAFKLRMKLDADKPRVIGTFDRFDEATIGGKSGEQQSMLDEPIPILVVKLIPMAMALVDRGRVIGGGSMTCLIE